MPQFNFPEDTPSDFAHAVWSVKQGRTGVDELALLQDYVKIRGVEKTLQWISSIFEANNEPWDKSTKRWWSLLLGATSPLNGGSGEEEVWVGNPVPTPKVQEEEKPVPHSRGGYRRTQTVEQTAKRWKTWTFLGQYLMVGSLALLPLGICSGAMVSSGSIVTLFMIGAGMYVIGKTGKWFYHE